jgi:hypothetical protein
MNKDISCIYTLVCKNEVLIVESNLKCFHEKVKSRNIGFNMSLSTIRNRFNKKTIFTFNDESNIYWLQKTLTK